MRRTRLVGIVALTAFATATAPAVARTIVDFARNAGHVDGFSAVSARTRPGERGRKLIATNRHGRLPNGLIDRVAEAGDSERLQGLGPGAFVGQCGSGSMLGEAVVPADVGSTYVDVPGFATTLGGPVSIETGTNCNAFSPQARRVGAGVYRVRLATIIPEEGGCDSPAAEDAAVTVTVRSESGTPLVATYRPVCDPVVSNDVVDEVRITDLDGARTDATFAIALVSYGGVPIP